MPTTNRGNDGSLGTRIVAPASADTFWPVDSRWRALIVARGEFRSPEWMLQQVKSVPLSSKVERSLLEWVRADDGRAILHHASEAGEHRVAAAVIAALRLARDHPDRSLRFLAWVAQGPDDPGDLRFLRRYLPGLHVLARLDTNVGAAIPLGRSALGLLAAELLRAADKPDTADQVLASLEPSAPVAVARAALRLTRGDYTGVHALAQDRPVADEVSVTLRVINAQARDLEGEPTAALSELRKTMDGRTVPYPVEQLVRSVRSHALRATGQDVEADLIDTDFGSSAPEPEPENVGPGTSGPPLFSRSLADALDDAWARVRRQPCLSPVKPLDDRDEIESLCEQAITLIGGAHLDTAETTLLATMDRADAWVDEGGPVVEDFYVLLAGLFNQQQMTTEEVATLERLRHAHRRAQSDLSPEVAERLVEARASLDQHS